VATHTLTLRQDTLPSWLVVSDVTEDHTACVDSNGGGFFRLDDPQALAALRDRIGDEGLERIKSSIALHKYPRPLTDSERMVLRETAAPVLRDLHASSVIVPDIREEAHEDGGAKAVCAWIQGPDGTSGTGIWVWLASPPAERVVELAEQLQEWEVDELYEAGRPTNWPECPEHPNSHRLSPEVHGDAAVWSCPDSGHVICAIGTVGTGR
jgi:hypothetical protein